VTHENALVAAALPQAHDVGNDDLGDGHQPAAANTRDGTENDELNDRGAEGSGKRAEEEEGKPGVEDMLAGPDIGQAAVEELE
jgi:hypothetical protein